MKKRMLSALIACLLCAASVVPALALEQPEPLSIAEQYGITVEIEDTFIPNEMFARTIATCKERNIDASAIQMQVNTKSRQGGVLYTKDNWLDYALPYLELFGPGEAQRFLEKYRGKTVVFESDGADGFALSCPEDVREIPIPSGLTREEEDAFIRNLILEDARRDELEDGSTSQIFNALEEGAIADDDQNDLSVSPKATATKYTLTDAKQHFSLDQEIDSVLTFYAIFSETSTYQACEKEQCYWRIRTKPNWTPVTVSNTVVSCTPNWIVYSGKVTAILDYDVNIKNRHWQRIVESHQVGS